MMKAVAARLFRFKGFQPFQAALSKAALKPENPQVKYYNTKFRPEGVRALFARIQGLERLVLDEVCHTFYNIYHSRSFNQHRVGRGPRICV